MNLDLSSLELPIRLRTEAPMSDDEFLRFSARNDPFRMEMEPNGEILIMTPTHTDTGFINSRIARALGNWADQDGRGDVGESSTGFRLPNGAVRSPDAAWVSHRRLEALTKAERKGFAPLYPEFVIELTSPTDRLKNVKVKMDEWIANGAELGWLIDPKRRRVTIYRPEQEPEVRDDPSSVQGTGCVAGFELVMERVWSRLRNCDGDFAHLELGCRSRKPVTEQCKIASHLNGETALGQARYGLCGNDSPDLPSSAVRLSK